MSSPRAEPKSPSKSSTMTEAQLITLSGRQYIDMSDESCSVGSGGGVQGEGNSQQVAFVANDLNAQLRLSSTGSPKTTELPKSPSTSSGTTVSNSSSLSPNATYMTAAETLAQIEKLARDVATNLQQVSNGLAGSLKGVRHDSPVVNALQMGELTHEHVVVYDSAVSATCDQVDQCIKGMYQLMAKFEELNTAAERLPQLAQQVNDIKRMLDLFEPHILHKDTA